MAAFFRESWQIREPEQLTDLIYRRWGRDAFSLPFFEGLNLLVYGLNAEIEEKLYRQWLTLYPLMATKKVKYLSFADYKDACTGANIDKRSDDEIIREIEELHGVQIKMET